MRLLRCTGLFWVSLGTIAAAQSSPSRIPSQSTPWKRYCQPKGGFCFKYPSSWSVLGEVYEGNGVVIAPPQKEDRSTWDSITVALVIPPPEADKQPLGLDDVIQQATSSLQKDGQSFETLQRQERTIDHKPAQMLKVRYREKPDGRDWIEQIIFIEGPDNEIYSVVLKSFPQDFVGLEPTLREVLAGWTLEGQVNEEAP
jgi:hypothetical protein